MEVTPLTDPAYRDQLIDTLVGRCLPAVAFDAVPIPIEGGGYCLENLHHRFDSGRRLQALSLHLAISDGARPRAQQSIRENGRQTAHETRRHSLARRSPSHHADPSGTGATVTMVVDRIRFRNEASRQ